MSTEETETTTPAPEENTGSRDIVLDQSEAANAFPVNGRTRPIIAAIVQPTEKLLLAALARTAKIVHDVAGTMY
jgi:hypothetical protein